MKVWRSGAHEDVEGELRSLDPKAGEPRGQGSWGCVLGEAGGCCQSLGLLPNEHRVTGSWGTPRVISVQMRIGTQVALLPKDGWHVLPFLSLSSFCNLSFKKKKT